jgi:hypothetical protein
MPEDHLRREFVRNIVFGASASVVAGTTRTTADEPKPKDDESQKKSEKTEVDARMELVLARFGKQLDDDARKAVRAEMEGIVRRAERLRKFELTNADGPFPVFAPYRAPLV